MAGVLFIINVPQKQYEVNSKCSKSEKEKLYVENKNTRINEDTREYTKPMYRCQSYNSLNTKDNSVMKSCSEITINVDELEGNKNSLKSSWDELKQTMKLRKKLKITRPVRGVDILNAFHWDTPLETILLEVMGRLDVKNATWCETRNNKFWQVTFSLESGNLCEELLQVLTTFGIGSRHQSSMSVLPCSLFYKSNHVKEKEDYEQNKQTENTAWSRFSSTVRARSNLAQVLHDVKTNATLTFDWLFQLIVAAFVASIGLVENSTVILVASMLISPLLGPITAGTLGTAARDRSLQRMGLQHEMLGLFMALVIGFVFGFAICAVDGRYGVVDDWPTPEMMSRCEVRSLWVGIMVAIPSGACVALAVLGDYTASLVGVAISASLLPPAVNAGLLWAMSLFRFIVGSDDINWVVTKPSQLAILGTASLCLTLVNIICIFMSGVAVYKIKQVYPLDTKDISWWRTNKNRLQCSVRDRCNTSAAWEIYSKWSNDSSTPNNTEDNQGYEDDVTQYKNAYMLKKMRTRSLENCLRNSKLNDTYQSLNSLETDTQTSDNTMERTQTDPNFTFFNLGFTSPSPSQESERPTLEPSHSFTLNSKRNCAVE